MKPGDKLYISLEDLIKAIKFQDDHDKYYPLYFESYPQEALYGLLKAGLVRAWVIPENREAKK